MTEDRSERLARLTGALVDVPSVSGDEDAILARLREAMPPTGFEIAWDDDTVVFYTPEVRRPDAPLVVCAGHVDTVPADGNVPGRREGDAIVGRGASDMKGSLALMVEMANGVASGELASDLDVGFVLYGREELPFGDSALMPFLRRCPAASAIDLAIVMEPTDNTIELGCLGNLDARIVAHGVAAHSARPWFGHNAVHDAIRALAPLTDLPTRDVEIDGLAFREVVSVTTIAGGVAANVVPDRAEARVNMRYAPTHTPAEAERRLRELLGVRGVEVEVVGNAPPGPVPEGDPLVARLQRATGGRARAKQAWTSVAEFGAVDIPSVNLGPGDPQYAHREDERIELASLERGYELMTAFLAGAAEG